MNRNRLRDADRSARKCRRDIDGDEAREIRHEMMRQGDLDDVAAHLLAIGAFSDRVHQRRDLAPRPEPIRAAFVSRERERHALAPGLAAAMTGDRGSRPWIRET